MTKRQKQAQETRRILFENAVTLFREKGFDSVTVEEITTRAGTAKGSFYTYFRTKSDIIIEEFKAIDDFYFKYQHNLKRYGTARARLTAFIKTQTKHVRDGVGIAMLKILYSTNISDPLAEKFLINPQRYLHALVKEIIVFGQENGEFRKDVDADAPDQPFDARCLPRLGNIGQRLGSGNNRVAILRTLPHSSPCLHSEQSNNSATRA